MARKCDITGTKPLIGNNVSHSKNRIKRRFLPNLQKKKIWIPEEKRWITLKLTSKALKTLEKRGYKAMLKKYNLKGF